MSQELELLVRSLDCPDVLGVNINIYNQPPYENIIGNIAESQGVIIPPLREYLSRLTEKALPSYNQPGLGDGNLGLATAMKDYQLNPKDRHGFMLPNLDSLTKSIEVVNQLGTELRMWSFWAEYLNTQRTGYRYDGEFYVGESNVPTPAESYRCWTLRKIKRADRLLLAGLEEVFRQDFRKISTSVILNRKAIDKGRYHISRPMRNK